MAESITTTIFVIKNSDGHFLEFQPYSGLRSWTNEYTDRCAFESQNAATLYCRSLIADAAVHGLDMEFDVYKHNNTITKTEVSIPDVERIQYGLPKKDAESEG